MKTKAPILPLLVLGALGSLASAQTVPFPTGEAAARGGTASDNLASDTFRAPARPTSKNVAQPQPSDGNQLLSQAVAELRRHPTIQAKIRQRTDLFGHQLTGNGSYQQQGRGEALRLRLELQINVADHSTSLLQVLDGRYLWIHRQKKEGTTLARVDLQQLQAAKAESTSVYAAVSPNTSSLALGGLPQLLERLSQSFDFQFSEQRTLGNEPVQVVRGRWKRDRLLSLLPDEKNSIAEGKEVDLNRLPAHLPQEVVIYLGQNNLFPYLIEYRRHDTDLPKTNTPKTIVAMEFYTIQFGARIERNRFRYNPGDLEVADLTDRYLDKSTTRK